MWKPEFNHQDVEVLARQTTFDGYFKVEKLKYRFRLYRGGYSPILERDVITKQHAAAVLLYHPEDDCVVLVEQFRQGAMEVQGSPWVLEPVAGTLDKSHDPLFIAKEEAKEEAGCEVLELIPVTTYLVSCGVSNEQTHVFCGRINNYQVHSIHGLEEEAEDIKVVALSSKQAFEMVACGEIFTASAVISLLWLQNNLQQVQARWKHKS